MPAKKEPPENYVLPETGYRPHDPDRPKPVSVHPGDANAPPSDAQVLFDGTNLDAWTSKDGAPAPWKVENGEMEVIPRSGCIYTRQSYGSVQLHLEFASPTVELDRDGQGRGNSGVFFHDDQYEVQVLDNYNNETYADGYVGAIYTQHPPLVNAIREPGAWNTYDIIFESPVFEGTRLVKKAFATVLLNGILVQNHTEILGRTGQAWGRRPLYIAHPPTGRIRLQDHKNPVRFRNIWVRDLSYL